jgi:hypothetical protein
MMPQSFHGTKTNYDPSSMMFCTPFENDDLYAIRVLPLILVGVSGLLGAEHSSAAAFPSVTAF